MMFENAPVLPLGYFYRLNPNGSTFGGPRETVDLCENRSFLWFNWVKVHTSAGVYRDDTVAKLLGLKPIRTPELGAAIRAYKKWIYDE